jgi:hypothetical protein
LSESQKFPVAAHALAYLAHKQAFCSSAAISSAALAASMPTNPVVVRRVTSMLAKAGLIATRAGSNGGAWLLKPAETIGLDQVLRAVHGHAHLGMPRPGAEDCPIAQKVPKAVGAAIAAADQAAAERLSHIMVSDLLKD